jgi:hypothetical protein
MFKLIMSLINHKNRIKMKYYFSTMVFAVAAIMLTASSCRKEIRIYEPKGLYTYSGTDPEGGKWKPIFSSTQYNLSTPSPVTSSAYLAELSNLKSNSGNLSTAQKELVEYWGNNSIIRWNIIACNLAAKYNLPPTPNPDGTYTAPDQNNPGNYPQFPFAHPPYACRMFAYWGTAQYAALINVWKEKFKHNRKAPYQVDGSISTALPTDNIPSYPSEDAAIAAVSKVILSAMFPLEAGFIANKANEIHNVRLWSGMNVQSDLTAGDSLGKAIAAQFIERSKTDGMKAAAGNKAVMDSINKAAQAKYGWHWRNLETPERKVAITPLFGNVKTWFVPSVADLRPGPPPAPNSAEWSTAVAELKGYMDDLSNEKRNTVFFWNDGVGTYTPAGHWNRFASEYIIEQRLNPLRTARVFAYLNASMMDAGIVCWNTKFYYDYPRPAQTDVEIKTLIGIPSFPSYVSGHAMFSSAASKVLSYFFPSKASDANAKAHEASDSRIYGRIHYRFDCEAGFKAGTDCGSLSVAAATADGAD